MRGANRHVDERGCSRAIPKSALCAAALCTAASAIAQVTNNLVPVNPATRDVSPLGVSNALQPLDLRHPTSWERVYEVRRLDNAASWRPSYRLGEVAPAPSGWNAGAGASWYARANGGLVAVFPRSTYVQTPQGTYADIPPGTVYGIGGVPSSVRGLSSSPGLSPTMPPNWAGGMTSAHARPANVMMAGTARASTGIYRGANDPATGAAPGPNNLLGVDAGATSPVAMSARAMSAGSAWGVPSGSSTASGAGEGAGAASSENDGGEGGQASAGSDSARVSTTRSIEVNLWSDEAYRARRIAQLIERAAKAE